MAFLFRKYTKDLPPEPEEEEEERRPLEWRLFPPSPAMQIALIGAGFFLLNCVLIAILAVALGLNR